MSDLALSKLVTSGTVVFPSFELAFDPVPPLSPFFFFFFFFSSPCAADVTVSVLSVARPFEDGESAMAGEPQDLIPACKETLFCPLAVAP